MQNIKTQILSAIERFRSSDLSCLPADGPGFAFLVRCGGELVHEEYAGMASLEQGIPISCDTTFNLASVTKLFTAAAVLRLCEQGRIQLDDALGAHVPEFSLPVKELKIRHLLAHGSGLSDDIVARTVRFGSVIGNPDVLDRVRTCPEEIAVEEPGTFKYSNLGYILLAALVERVAGLSFSGFLNKEILEPLALKSARLFTERKPVVPHRAQAYGQWPDGAYALQFTSVLTVGDGGLFINAGDMVKFCCGVFAGNVLSAQTVAEMLRPVVEVEPGVTYGLGWRVLAMGSGRVVFHTGTDAGFANIVGCVPDKDVTVVLLSNFSKHFSNAGGRRQRLIEQILLPLL